MMIIIYMLIAALSAFFLFRFIYLKREKRLANEKFKFIIRTAHEILTPLTLIKAPLEVIKGSEQLTREGILNLSTALRNVNTLLQMSNNLINFEQASQAATHLTVSDYELNAYMAETVESYRSKAEEKKINFTYDSNFRFLTVWIDKEKMDTILRNVIANALKYTPERGSVSIYASENEDRWSFEVKDTGMGIPPDELPKVFKEQFRGKNITDVKIEGNGIGMMLTGELIKTHKGKVKLSSILNKGTTVTISFPQGKSSFKKSQIVPKVDSDAPSELSLKAHSVDTKRVTNGPRILIVEDNDEMRTYLEQMLCSEYIIQSCNNGKDAIIIIQEYKPELVIADVIMPGMRGDDLCSLIKSQEETSHIAVILITGLNDEESILRGIQTGADEYLLKPFNIGILKATMANLLSNRALLRSKYGVDERMDDDLNLCINCSNNIDWEFIANMKKYIEKHMADPDFTVDTLCAKMGMSRTSLYNKIKQLTDTSPSDYIRILRLKRAAELLKEGVHNVTEVAEMTGFGDAKYFREVFKKHYNVSPSKYKDEVQES